MPATRLSRRLVSLSVSAITAVYTAGYVRTQVADDLLGGPSGSGAQAVSDAPSSTPAPVLTLTGSTTPIPATLTVAATPSSLVITDAAVEQYADLHHISWDDARAQMEASAGLVHTPTQPSSDATPIANPVGVADATAAAPPRAAAAPRAGAVRVPTTAPTPVRRVAPATPTSAAVAGYKDGTYTGVGTSRRGDVQVSVAVQGGRIASVSIMAATTQYPTRFIAGLPAQVVSRQTAQVDVVSGATYSSLAFRGAVQQALQRAKS